MESFIITMILQSFTRISLILIYILGIYLTSSKFVITTQTIDIINHRCSHIPPEPEQVSHILLDNVHSNEYSGNNGFEFIIESNNNSEHRSNRTNKAKRHVSNKNLIAMEIGNYMSIWNMFKKLPKQQQPLSQLEKEYLTPMKIHVHYDYSVRSLERPKLELISEKVMPSVVHFFESVLSIRREDKIDTFKMTRKCPNNTIYFAKDSIGPVKPYCMDRCEDYAICGEVIVPKSHLSACSYCNSTSKRCSTYFSTEGVGVPDAQLVLYVSAKQSSRCKKDQTIAYAAHCAQDSKTDRPVAGHINLCPSSISVEGRDYKSLISTVKHELTHVLGFSVSLFSYYRDDFGNPLTERETLESPILLDPRTGYAKWSNKIIKKVKRSNWVTGAGLVDKDVYMIVTPTVVKEVREHFNCSTLEGAELEDQGSDGTSMTHWEKRLFENEAMTGTHTQNSVYSRLTLAVLQDTGWYAANLSRAEKLNWGKDLGCEFAKKSCKSWIDERQAKGLSIKPFCDRVKGEILQISCTDDRSSKAVCNMKQYKEPLPSIYKNFDHLEGIHYENLTFYGGSVDLADYCPFIQEFTWQAQNVTTRGSRCDVTGSSHDTDRHAALEIYGEQTKCFEHGRRWEQRSCGYKRHWHHHGAGCYRYTCVDGHFDVSVGNYSYSCYYPNQTVEIEQIVDQWAYNGTLICPACEAVCPIDACKLYDKRLIDKVVELNNELAQKALKLSEEDIKKYIENTLNTIETDYPTHMDHFGSKSELHGHIDNLEESIKESNSYDKEQLLEMLARYREPPRQWLECSSAHIINISNACLLASLVISLFSHLEFRFATMRFQIIVS